MSDRRPGARHLVVALSLLLTILLLVFGRAEAGRDSEFASQLTSPGWAAAAEAATAMGTVEYDGLPAAGADFNLFYDKGRAYDTTTALGGFLASFANMPGSYSFVPGTSALAPPTNDYFAAATVLGTDSGSLANETNVDATVESGEPAHAGYGPARSVWYVWTPSVTGNALVDIDVASCCTDDLLIGVYTGSSVDALTEVTSAGPSYTAVHIEFPVTAATTYYLAVAGQAETDMSSFDLDWDMGPANDYFAAATVLGTDSGSLANETNVDASVESGEPAHAGYGPARSVWYVWTPSVTGNALVDIDVASCCTDDLLIVVYTGSSVAALTEVTSAGPSYTMVHVAFPVTAATTYYLAVAGVNATDASQFDLAWQAQPIPANDDFTNATTLVGDSGWLLAETNEWATAEPGEPSHNDLAGTPVHSVWYQWTPATNGTAVVTGNTRPYSSVTYIVMAAYTGSAVDALTEVAAWGGNGIRTVRLEFAVVAGTTYHIVLDGYDEDETSSFDLTWALSPPANDDFADPTVLAEEIGTMTAESNELATPEVGEPIHAGVAGTPARSVWYEWTPIWDGSATIDIDTPSAPDDWHSVGVVYTGSNLAALTEVAAASTTGNTLHLEFEVVGGATYRLVVDGQDSDNWGVFDLTWENEPVSGHFFVTKTEDTDDGACDSDCSLREAVVAANATGGDDTIDLPAGLYQLTLDTHLAADHYGSLDVEREAGTTSILGAGRETTIIDATTLRTLGLNNPDRVFTVGYHAGLELVGMTVTGGYTKSGGSTEINGGGIWNWNGTLNVTDCIIEGNTAVEGGGGIANHYGAATITNTIVRGNTTNAPNHTSDFNWGGGIQNTGTMIVTGSEITGNSTNKFGHGGGIANAGIIDVLHSTISGNHAPVGGGISTDWAGSSSGEEWRATIASSAIISNTSERNGGGIFTNATGILSPVEENVAFTLIDTIVLSNIAEDGDGGGVYNSGSVVEIHRSTISNNFSNFGGAVYNSKLHNGGAVPGSVLASNSTLSVNGAQYGGAVYNVDPGTTVLTNSTVTGNGAWLGGGIANDGPYSTTLTIENTIIAGNGTGSPGSEDCSGHITSLGFNLVGDATGCPAGATEDITTSDPMLSPLADFGGSTLTHALLPGSPAINAGATDLAVDQRGILRPQGPTDDIGAFEVEHGPNAPPVLEAIGDLAVDEGDTLEVAVTTTDADGGDLVLWLDGEPGFVSLTAQGTETATLNLTPGFTDAGSYPGVTIVASDGVDIDEESITIVVTDVNAIPVADDQLLSTWQGTSLEITLTGSDVDGDDLTYTIFELPAHGDLSGTPPVVTYTPDSEFVGEDSFTFTTFDGEATSTPGTVQITVHNVRPDPTFGTDGTVLMNFGYLDMALAVVEQTDGTILVAGWARPDELSGTENANAVVAKLGSDGSLDLSFGVGGLAAVTGRDNYFYDLVVEPDGQIVAVGKSKPDVILGGDPLIARFDADGTLDTSFGTNGLVMPDLDGEAAAVALQPDGKIIVAGGWGSYEDFGVIRLLANGELDLSFGANGVTEMRHAGNDLLSDILVQPDDNILSVGTIDRFNEWNDMNIGLVRLLPDGSPDTTFDGDGEAIINLGMGESGHGVALQPDGKILIAGDIWEPFNRDAIILRTTSTGGLDTTFGSNGVANIPFGGDFEQFNGLVLQTDGAIVAAGSSGDAGAHDFIVARLLADGSLDPSFDFDGKVTHDLGGDDLAWALTVQMNGRLLLAGQKDWDWAILRLRAMDDNQVPVLDPIGDQSLAEVGTLDVAISASDNDGDPLTFTLSGEPGFAVLVNHGNSTATLSLTPGFDDAGVYPGLNVTVSDGFAADSEPFTITVMNTNQVPVLDTIGNQSVSEGGVLDVIITASDLDGDTLSFDIMGEPAFATLVDHGDYTATLSLSPGSDTAGVYPGVTIIVSDSFAADSETFNITVTKSNQAPVLDEIGDQSVAEGANLDVGITALDADGDPLTFSLSGEPGFATLVDHGDGTATLTLDPGFDDAGVYPGVTVTVSDSVNIDSETFIIMVKETLLLFLPLVRVGH